MNKWKQNLAFSVKSGRDKKAIDQEKESMVKKKPQQPKKQNNNPP